MHSWSNVVQSLFGFLSRLRSPFIILSYIVAILSYSTLRQPSQGGDSAEHAEVIGAELLEAELDCVVFQIESCSQIKQSRNIKDI